MLTERTVSAQFMEKLTQTLQDILDLSSQEFI